MRSNNLIFIFLITLINSGIAASKYAGDCSQPAAPGVNWSYCNKESGQHGSTTEDLSRARLSGAVLFNTSFRGQYFYAADFSGADLRFANFNDIKVGLRLDFYSAQLHGATFQRVIYGT